MSLYFYSNTYFPKKSVGDPLDARRPFDNKTFTDYYKWSSNLLQNFDNEIKHPEVECKLHFAKDEHSLYEKLSLDINAEAKFNLGGGNISFQWEKEIDFNERQLVYLLNGSKIYSSSSDSHENIKFEINDEGISTLNKLKENKNAEIFPRIFGSEIITQIQRGAFFSIIYVFNFSSKKIKEEVQNSFHAEWGNVEVNMNSQEFRRRYDKNLSIDFYIHSNSLDTTKGFATISSVLNDSVGNIPSLKEAIINILTKDISNDQNYLPIVAFSTKSIMSIPSITSDAILLPILISYTDLSNIIDKSINFLYQGFVRSIKQIEFLETLLNETSEKDLNEGGLTIIDNKIEEYRKQQMEILKKYLAVLNAVSVEEAMTYNFTKVLPLKFTQILKDTGKLIDILTWNAETSRGDIIALRAKFQTLTYPRIHIKIPGIVKLINAYKGEQLIKFFEKDEIVEIERNHGVFTGNQFLGRIYNNETVPNNNPDSKQNKERKLEIQNKFIKQESGNEYFLEFVFTDGSYSKVNIGNVYEPNTFGIPI